MRTPHPISFSPALILTVALLLTGPPHGLAEIVRTTDPTEAAAFLAGAAVEGFDDLTAQPIESYAPGQAISPSAQFNSRNGLTQPTFNSGGGSPNDPVGNPGTPVGIFDPVGPIAGDVRSPDNVAGPLVVDDPTQPFNDGFLEIFFAQPATRVGFWVTHGSVSLNLLDEDGLPFATGDSTTTAVAGEFVGIDRGAAEIKIATVLPNGTDAFTIDDVGWFSPSPRRARLAWVDQVRNGFDGVLDLDAPQDVEASSDGRFLYVASAASNALVVLERDPQTGRLAFLESHRDGVAGVEGLGSATNVELSPDGAHVYVASGSDSIAVFTRDPLDGRLQFVEAHQESQNGVFGIASPFDIEVSPDGAHVYVPGHNSQTIAIFGRDVVSGALSYQGAVSNEIVASSQLPDQICMSPDSRHLYLASFFSAILVFERDSASGDLSFVEVVDLPATTSDCVISPDGRFAYVPGATGTIEILDRDATTGSLSPRSVSEPVSGFVGRLSLSADGRSLISAGARLAVFEREAGNGSLQLVQELQDGVQGVDGIGGFGSGNRVAVSGDGRHLYASGGGDDAIGIFSWPRFRFADVRREGVGGVENALENPSGVAVSGDSQMVYVTDRGSSSVSVFEIDPLNDRLELIETKLEGDLDVGSGLVIDGITAADAVALAPDEAQLYVLASQVSSIARFDLDVDGTLVYRGAITVPELDMPFGGGDLVVSGDGVHLFVVNFELQTWVAFERLGDGSLVHLPFPDTSAPFFPAGIAKTPDDEYVMVANTDVGGNAVIEAYRRESDGHLSRVDSVVALARTDFGSLIARGIDLETSADGRHVYLTVATVFGTPLPQEGAIVAATWDAASETLAVVDVDFNESDGAISRMAFPVDVAVSAADDLVAATAGVFQPGGILIFARDSDSGELWLAQEEDVEDIATNVDLRFPLSIEFTPDDRYLLVTGTEAGSGSLALFVPEPGVGSMLLAGAALLGALGRRTSRGAAPAAPRSRR